jgi:pimeloyl-ACP methyl ester carboxylesterase
MEHVTSTDGTPIAYDHLGTGPAVVIIGGGPTTRMVNTELAERLASRFTVINYDRRGHGDSGNTPPFTVDKEYADLAAVLTVAGEPARLVGSSGGAVIALEAAARGLSVARLALWEPSYVIDDDSRPPVPADYREQLERLIAAGRHGDAVTYFFRAAAALPEEFVAPMRTMPFWPAMEQIAPLLIHDAQVVGDFSIPVERLVALDVPTLVLDGGTTPWLSHTADAVADLVPGAKRQTLAGQPHNVDPAVLADAVRAFLADENGLP